MEIGPNHGLNSVRMRFATQGALWSHLDSACVGPDGGCACLVQSKAVSYCVCTVTFECKNMWHLLIFY